LLHVGLPMVNLGDVCQLPRMAAVFAAATVLLAGASIAQGKADHGDNSHHLIPVVKNEGKDKHKDEKEMRVGKEGRRESREAKRCRKPCRDAPTRVPVIISNAAGKTRIKVGPTDVLGFSAKNGTVSVTEFKGVPGGLRFVSFGGSSITLSSSVANALRLGASNGKAGNIEVDNTVSVKQNPDGSVTITTTPPTLIGR
jgi:hypothetical protein